MIIPGISTRSILAAVPGWALIKQLQEVNRKLAAFPDHDKYAVDCFALDLRQKFNGLPLYDYGVTFK